MRIIVVDDEATQAELLAGALRNEGHDATAFSLPEKALEALAARGADLLITDHRMPRMTGLALIQKALALDPGLLAIILTAYGTVQDAVEAMKAGAFDYLTKPVDLDHLLLLVGKARAQQDLIRENRDLKKSLERYGKISSITGDSPAMREVFSKIHRVAPTEATVLITGESGTGKELVARAVHRLSQRQNGPFVAVNCAALPETLLESELFGHEKGAFTGAVARRAGKFEAAEHGTLFLDEIGDIPPSLQVKLLRFLQDRTYEPLGSNQTRKADSRLIAATNASLEDAVARGAFREDLYYRLNVVGIHVPPLRDRKSDIPELIRFFIGKFSKAHARNVSSHTKDVYDILIRHPYPGNVRELENIIENAVVMCRSNTLTQEDLPAYLLREDAPRARGAGSLPEILDETEKRLIVQALEESGHVQVRAAESLGISERVLRYKMKKLGLAKL